MSATRPLVRLVSLLTAVHSLVHAWSRARWAAAATVTALLVAGLLPVSVAAASGPVITTQPGSAVYNQSIAPEAVVAIKDGGSVVTSATGTMTMGIAVGTGTPGAVLTCTGTGAAGRTFSLVNGVATATGCAIDRAGIGYRLVAGWSQGGAAISTPFDIMTGAPAKLGFVAQPAGAVDGFAFLTQPVVEVQDAAGQRITTSSAAVTLSIATGTGVVGASLTCAGGTGAVAVAGVATFSGCRLDRPGLAFALSGSSLGLVIGTSALFDVASPTPAKLGFVVQPARGAPTSTFEVQPAVAIQDANGVTIPTASPRSITLWLGANPGVGSLACADSMSRTTVNGIATFSGCAVNLVGVGYSVIAGTSGLLSVTSGPFDVADRLSFTQRPASATVGEPFAAEPVVVVWAGPSNPASHDQGTRVALSIKPGTGTPGAILSCDGGLVQSPINAVVQFGTCSIDRPGSGYMLAAAAPHLASATSPPFSVAPGPFTVIPSVANITWGKSVTLAVDLHPNGGSGAGRTISLLAARDGLTWSTIATLVTSSTGHASLVYRPASNLYYCAVFAGTADLAGATSPRARVVVRQTASLRPSNGGLVKVIPHGTAVTFATTVGPAKWDLPIPTVTFLFYRQVGGVWTNVAKRVVTAGSTGVARTTWRFQVAGEWYVRSMANPTLYNASSVLTPAERYSVR